MKSGNESLMIDDVLLELFFEEHYFSLSLVLFHSSCETFSISLSLVCLVGEEIILCIPQINTEFLLIFFQLVYRFLSEEFCEDKEEDENVHL